MMTIPAIRPMNISDWDRVAEIYAEGIATGIATFETAVPAWEKWDMGHVPSCRLVAELAGEVVGWVALSAVSQRYVYRGVAEHSIYVAASAQGQGIGKSLLNSLIVESEKNGFWTLQTGILRRNTGSVALHQKCGFRLVGIRERLGERDGVWHDVVMMERRSTIVGT